MCILGSIRSMIGKAQDTTKSTAKVVDGRLVISLPDAMEPVVWHMDFEKVSSSSFKTKKLNDNGEFSLIVEKKKNGSDEKGTIEEIAKFKNRETAMFALMQTSTAIQHGNTGGRSSSSRCGKTDTSSSTTEDSNAAQWLMALVAAALVVGMFLYVGKIAPKTVSTSSQGVSIPEAAEGSTGNQVETGVPMDADKLLGGF